jgi:MFS transporter, DHA2 family, multidrug resistance protein
MVKIAALTHPGSATGSRALATWGLMIATAMQAADATIANVAIPQLQRDLGGGVELGAWVITSYLCATAVIAPLTGWLRRRIGTRNLFTGAIMMFVGASLLCAASPSAAIIILCRILQGAGGGVIHPLAQAILLDIHPREKHGRILALWGAAAMTGPIVGPLIGGIATDLASWRLAFAINLPVGALALWAVRQSVSEVAAQPNNRGTVDALGVVLLMLAVGGLQLCLERGIGHSWLQSPELMGEGLVALVASTLLVARARRGGFSVIRTAVFRDVNFSTAAFYNFSMSGLLFVAVVFLPLLAEGPLGLSATISGATIVPRALLMTLMMLVIGRIMGRVNYRILLAAGWLLMAAGLAILSAMQPETGLERLIIGSTIQAIGAGMLITPHSTLGFTTLAAELRTDGTGVYSLLRQLGMASAVALMTAVLRLRVASNLPLDPASAGHVPPDVLRLATLQAYGDCFRYMALATLAIIPGIFFFRLSPVEEPETDTA